MQIQEFMFIMFVDIYLYHEITRVWFVFFRDGKAFRSTLQLAPPVTHQSLF